MLAINFIFYTIPDIPASPMTPIPVQKRKCGNNVTCDDGEFILKLFLNICVLKLHI